MKSNYVINLTSIATEEEKCDILINNLNDVIKIEEKLSTELSDDMLDYLLDKVDDIIDKLVNIKNTKDYNNLKDVVSELKTIGEIELNSRQFINIA